MNMCVYEVINRMLVEEVLDCKERANKELSCAMTPAIESGEINKKNRGDISVTISHHKFFSSDI